MRSFVAASCCAIVGLEILIGVPVAVCLGFFCFGSEFSGAYVAETQYQQPIYAGVPYTPSALPPGKPVMTFDPYASCPPPPLPALCPAPPSARSGDCEEPQLRFPSYTVAAAHDPLVEPAADSAPPPVRPSSTAQIADSPAGPQTVVGAGSTSRLTIGDAQQLVARVCSEESCPEATAESQPDTLAELTASIRRTTHLLYRHAERREEAGEFSEADCLRNLARELRQEGERLTHTSEEAPLLSEAPVSVLPSGVTVGPPPRG
jgi:hypothetical protein